MRRFADPVTVIILLWWRMRKTCTMARATMALEATVAAARTMLTHNQRKRSSVELAVMRALYSTLPRRYAATCARVPG